MTSVLKRLALILILPALLALGACGDPAATQASSDAPDSPPSPYTIATTIGMITDIVARVAGDRAEVEGLVDAGIDPHLYAPTRSDVQRLMDAHIIFYNGLLLEGKMTDSLIRAGTSGRPVHAVTEQLDETFLLSPDDFEGHFDPHVWMDPSAWAKAVEIVRDRLAEFDPEGASTYRANAEALLQEIDEVDRYAERVLASIPEGRRVLVTAHDAFNYFGRRHGFEVVGIQGISTASEAGVLDVERLVDLIVERRIPAVFVESTVSERNINALIAGARARGHEVTIGGELFSDAMGQSGTYEGTYIGMIDHNATTIARALGGEAPERGLHGKLAE